MADSCSLFGGILPDVYLDKVFLETKAPQGLKITANLKLIDQRSENGTYALLGDAIDQDLKEYFKIYCVLTTSTDASEYFEGLVGEASKFLPVGWQTTDPNTHPNMESLNNITSEYINNDGNVELIISNSYDLDNDSLAHLSLFAYVQLDTNALEADKNLELPESLKNMIGNVERKTLIENSRIMSSEVQDFRIREEIDVLMTELTSLTADQLNFPEQQEILAQLTAKSSYFSEIFMTKDANRNTRFFFAFDHGKYVLEKSKYSNLISNMSAETKQTIIENSRIVQFILSKRQVETVPAKNELASPVQNKAFRNAKEEPVILSLDDNNINEIDLILTAQTSPSDSLVKYFTGIDTQLKSDGLYQYMVDVEILDGFIPVIKQLHSDLEDVFSNYQQYVALAQMPKIYDAKSRKFTTKGISTLESFAAADRLENMVSNYLSVLGFFVELSDVDGYREKILNLIQPSSGGVDGVLLFNNLISLLQLQINNILKVGHSGGGLEDTVSNQPSDSAALFKPQAIKMREIFDNTIDARFINESYMDYISADKDNSFAGLTIYNQSDILNATTTISDQSVESDSNLGSEESLGLRNVTILHKEDYATPSCPASTIPATSLLSKGEGASGALNTELLSADDLAQTTFNLFDYETDSLFKDFLSSTLESRNLPGRTPGFRLARAIASTNDLPSLETIDVLVGFTVPQISVNELALRNAVYEQKTPSQISQLASDDRLTQYYLCRQQRESDVEIVDSYFLFRPTRTLNLRQTQESNDKLSKEKE